MGCRRYTACSQECDAHTGQVSRPVPGSFVLIHTRPDHPSLVPGVRLQVADDVVTLWEAMEDERGRQADAPPFWAAAWPGGQVLARHVLDSPEVVAGRRGLDLGSGRGGGGVAAAPSRAPRGGAGGEGEVVAGRRVLDLGSGSGLVAIAAALSGAARVVASEIDEFGVTAIALNAQLNGVSGIDIVGDLLAGPPPDVDVVLAGDICYDREMTERVLPFLDRACAAGAEVLIGDPGGMSLPVDRLTAVVAHEVPETEGPGLRRSTVWRLA